MVKQYIELGDSKWGIVVCYGVESEDSTEVSELLRALGCPEDAIKKSVHIMTHKLNSALTFSNTKLKMSLICIGETSSQDLLVNSIVHEAKHVLSHVCLYYDIDEDSEPASYLIGYIVLRMYIGLRLIKLKYYGRF